MASFRLFFLATFLVPISVALAEYRVYQLRLTDPTNGQERTVLSTLDHIQYPDYYPTYGMAVEYIDSWMCWESTAHFRDYCPNPTPPAPEVEDDNQGP